MRLSASILLIIALGFTLGPAFHFFDLPLNCCSTSSCHNDLSDFKQINVFIDNTCGQLLGDSCCSPSNENQDEPEEEDHKTCNPFHCFHCVKVFLTLNLEFSVNSKNIMVSSKTPPYVPHRGIRYQIDIWHPPLFV